MNPRVERTHKRAEKFVILVIVVGTLVWTDPWYVGLLGLLGFGGIMTAFTAAVTYLIKHPPPVDPPKRKPWQ